METEQISRIAFIIGIVISVIAGFFDLGTYGLPALVLLGVIVGFLNVTGKEIDRFLIGVIALMIVGASLNTTLGAMFPTVAKVLSTFVTFVAGAGLLVALKEIYLVAKD